MTGIESQQFFIISDVVRNLLLEPPPKLRKRRVPSASLPVPTATTSSINQQADASLTSGEATDTTSSSASAFTGKGPSSLAKAPSESGRRLSGDVRSVSKKELIVPATNINPN